MSGAGSGRGEERALLRWRPLGWLESPSPQLYSPSTLRRGRATHTLYGSRGSDVSVILKETFDLRKREGEIKVGQRDRGMGRLESQHLHGAVVRDRNLAANPRGSSHFHPGVFPNSGPRLLPQAGVLRRCGCPKHCLKIGPRGSSWAELTRSK